MCVPAAGHRHQSRTPRIFLRISDAVHILHSVARAPRFPRHSTANIFPTPRPPRRHRSQHPSTRVRIYFRHSRPHRSTTPVGQALRLTHNQLPRLRIRTLHLRHPALFHRALYCLIAIRLRAPLAPTGSPLAMRILHVPRNWLIITRISTPLRHTATVLPYRYILTIWEMGDHAWLKIEFTKPPPWME